MCVCVIMCGERDGGEDKGSVSQRGNVMVGMRLLFGTVVFVSLCCCICFLVFGIMVGVMVLCWVCKGFRVLS